jgi:methionyl-tRNA formyltransferase
MTAPPDATSATVPSKIVICGKGRIATGALSFTAHYCATQRVPCTVAACPNSDDRGYDTWTESLARAAALLDVPAVLPADVEDVPDLLLISLEYDRIIPVARFKSSRLYNIHFSALPRYRGVFTSIWPLLNRESKAGVSLHVMDAGVDTGDVIDQRSIHIAEYTTARQLYEHYMDEGLALFRDWLPRLIASIPAATPQDSAHASSYSRRSLDLKRLELPLAADGERICAFVRAFSFPEYQRPTIGGRGVRSCAILQGTTNAAPGTVLNQTGFSTAYAVGNGGIVEIIWA